MNPLSRLSTEARRGTRSLWRSPGFALAAIATLALGIGANTAIFSVVDAVLLEPLPWGEPERRVMLWSRWEGFEKTWLSEAEVLDYRRDVPSLSRVAAWFSTQANVTGDGPPLRVGLARVTSNIFETLGSAPALGRTFTEAEAAPGAAPVVVLRHGLWQRRYGGDPAVLDASLNLDGTPHRILGVMPPGFQLPTDFGEDAAAPSELWVPFQIDAAAASRGSHGLYGVAELAPGATAQRATAELATLTARLTSEGLYPESMRFSAFAVPLRDEIVGPVRPALLLVFGAVGFLLLIACANVANLLLVRGEARRRELALRAALGASRLRLAGQMLAESFALAVPAPLLGLVLAWAGLRALLATAAIGIPRAGAAGLDRSVLAFTVLATLATVLLFGLLPALRASRIDLNDALRDGSQTATSGTGRQRLRAALVVAQVALSVVLLLGAGLMLRSLRSLAEVDIGFRARDALTLSISLPSTRYPEATQVDALQRAFLERVRALPGVEAAGLIRSLPLGSQIGDWGVQVEGYQNPFAGHGLQADWQVASDGAAEALGLRLVAGRSFRPTDAIEGRMVAMVNETMARSCWPDGDPIGRRIRMGGRDRDADEAWMTVVGVVADVRHNGILRPVKNKFYVPYSQFARSVGRPMRPASLVVRASSGPLRQVAPVRAALAELDADLPIAAVSSLEDVVAASIATPRLAGTLLGMFAALAVALSAVGIYGVLAFIVGTRTRELGIRLAIGAEPRALLRLVLRHGMGLAASGVVVGVFAATGLTGLLAGLLYGVAPHDPLTFALVPLAALGVAGLASYLPARRALRIDPARALRTE
jgi:predicted permease